MKSWNEIRKNATAFAKRWKTAFDEKSQAQSFLKEFFEVFGVDTVQQATFEHRVKFADGTQGFVDMFWPGRILVEMKSRGKDLDAAFAQAMDYVRALPDAATLPRAIVVSDFQTFRFYDLAKDNARTSFKLADLRKYVTLFGFMIGGESDEIREQDPVNRRAAEKMARLHDALKAIGYRGRELEVYLVRLLFCLFAEDTSIFKPAQFSNFIRTSTVEDGSDLAAKIAVLFQTLNTPPERRLASLDETVAAFPYVNGNLFGEMLSIPAFSGEMRRALLDCGSLDWSKISPAIFGAMFQGVMDEEMRHDLGAHYTSEENILKVIRPLFLDRLREEFDVIVGKSHAEGAENAELRTSAKNSLRPPRTPREKKIRLQEFHDRISRLTFLDPACGCGNFLLIAYRELRRLEADVLAEIYKDDPSGFLDISSLCKVDVSQFHGIEIGPFASEIAKVALWLMDHLCNLDIADRFGQYFARIPIKASPHIVCANALTTDWRELLSGERCKSGVEFVAITADFDFKKAKSHLQDLKRAHASVQNSEGARFRFTNQVMKALSDKARDQSVDRKVHWAAVANIERLCEKSVSLWNEKPRNGSADIDHYAKHGCPFVFGGVAYIAKITSKAYPSEGSLATYSVEAISVEKNFARGITDAISKKQHLDPSDANRILKFVETVKGAMKPFDYIFGNPPFLGRTMKTAEQQAEISSFFDYKDIDFVACWYAKANDLMQGSDTRCAFVSTNSITQGEQVAPLWRRMNAEIDFAYRTFKWHNEAKNNAAVHCVIIGFHAAENVSHEATESTERNPEAKKLRISVPPCGKTIYDGDAAIPARHINGYLMDAPDAIIESRSTPICAVPPMCFGNMPLDGGNLIIEAEDYEPFVRDEPQARPFIKPLVGSREFLNRLPRYCLWLEGASPALIAKCPHVKERIAKCRAFREASKAASTRKLSDTAALFRDRRNPPSAIIVPSVSSERRHYVPIGFVSSETIVSNLALFIPSATLYHFGVLTSRMHMAWMRAVAGRLKSDYRYSKDVVYNNFVWPAIEQSEQSEQSNIRTFISSAAQEILDVRQKYLDADPECTLAILYNPETMPLDLVKAHQKLDSLVDRAYGRTFTNDAERVAHLFNLYAQCVAAEKLRM